MEESLVKKLENVVFRRLDFSISEETVEGGDLRSGIEEGLFRRDLT